MLNFLELIYKSPNTADITDNEWNEKREYEILQHQNLFRVTLSYFSRPRKYFYVKYAQWQHLTFVALKQ